MYQFKLNDKVVKTYSTLNEAAWAMYGATMADPDGDYSVLNDEGNPVHADDLQSEINLIHK